MTTKIRGNCLQRIYWVIRKHWVWFQFYDGFFHYNFNRDFPICMFKHTVHTINTCVSEGLSMAHLITEMYLFCKKQFLFHMLIVSTAFFREATSFSSWLTFLCPFEQKYESIHISGIKQIAFQSMLTFEKNMKISQYSFATWTNMVHVKP